MKPTFIRQDFKGQFLTEETEADAVYAFGNDPRAKFLVAQMIADGKPRCTPFASWQIKK